MISLITCTDLNGAIGKEGKLLANMPDELEHFKAMTLKKVCIMGSKTFDSIIRMNGKPLEDRMTVVLTSKPLEYQDIFKEYDLLVFTDDVVRLLEISLSEEDQEVMVCGGEEVYKQFMPFADTAYVSTILDEFEGADAHFPVSILEKRFEPKETDSFIDSVSGYAYNITRYTKIKENI